MEGHETEGKTTRNVFQTGNDVEEFGCMKEASEQRKKTSKLESAGIGSTSEPPSYNFIQERGICAATAQKAESGLQSSSSSDKVFGSSVRPKKSRKLKRDNLVEESMETVNSKGFTVSSCRASQEDSPLLPPVKSSLKGDLEVNCNTPYVSPDIFLPTDRNDAEKQYKKHVFAESIPLCHDHKATCITSCSQAKRGIESDSKAELPWDNFTSESNASAVTAHDIRSGACSNSSFNEVLSSSIRREKNREQEKMDNTQARHKHTENSEGTKSSTCSLSENCNALSVFISRDTIGIEKQFEKHDLAESAERCKGLGAACGAHYSNGELVPDVASSLLPNRKESPSSVPSLEAQPSFCSEHVEKKEFDNSDARIPLLELCALRDEVSYNNDKKLLSQEGSLHGNSPKKLLVLDINGLLADVVYHVREGYTPDTIVSGKSVFKRPFCDEFLEFCFARFNVGVWSSRIRRNVELILDFLMGNAKHKLLFIWDQYHCTNSNLSTLENREKPLLVKKLKKLWEKYEPSLPWELGEYNESNTLLLDDSPYKAVCNPPYTAVFPATYQYRDKEDNSLGPGGELRMYLEGLAMAENVQKYVEENPIGYQPITENNPSWRFYRKVIHACSSPENSPPRTAFHWQRYRW